MSSPLNPLFIACLLIAVVVSPSLAYQSAAGTVTNSTNVNQKVFNIETTNNNNDIDIEKQVVGSTYITVEAPESNPADSINYLGVGDVDESVLMYPMEVLSYPTQGNQTFLIRSAVPIAVYSIGRGNDRLLLDSSESMLTYDPLYHRFEHGVVSPQQVFPHFTTKCTMYVGAPGYIVLDNRYFPDYAIVEIQSI